MANIFLNIPVVVGVGGAVDISAMGAEKTIVVSSPLAGALTLEISEDAGVSWCQLVTFTVAGKKVISFAGNQIRARSSSGVGTVNIGANDDGGLYVDIPAPPINGIGAAVDISALGNFTTVNVQGPCGGGVIGIQVSENGVDFAEFATFPDPGCVTKTMVGDFVRAVSRGASGPGGPYAPVCSMGAINDGASSPSSSVTDCFVYQPNNTGVSGPVVFFDWYALYDALQAARIAGGAPPSGCFTIVFSESAGPVLPPGPVSFPPGVFDMTDVKWKGENQNTRVEIFEGGGPPFGSGFTNLRKITDLLIFWSGSTPPVADFNSIPFSSGDTFSMHQVSIVSSGSTGPFFDISADHLASTRLYMYNSSLLTGESSGPPGPPLIDIALDNTLLLTLGSNCFISNNAFSGPVGSSMSIATPSPGTLVKLDQPLFLGTIFGIDNNLQATQWCVQPTIRFAPSPITEFVGQINKFDTSGGAFTQVLTKASFAIPGATLWIKKVGGASPLTIDPFPGDTIDGLAAGPVIATATGSLMLMKDFLGINNWLILVLQ